MSREKNKQQISDSNDTISQHSFLCDKYLPKKICDMSFHRNIIQQLFNMSDDNAVPHIILYGPKGSGKKTLANMLLRKIFDDNIDNISNVIHNVNGSGNKKENIEIKQSPYHIIINPNNNNFDRYLIQDIVKNYARIIPLDAYAASKNFKVVLINDIDNLSYYAQMSLRRTMEKYSHTCRFLMLCNSISKIIDPLKSRCLCTRVNSPSDPEIIHTILSICLNEQYIINPIDLANIVEQSHNNIGYSIWALDCLIHNITMDNSFNVTIQKICSTIMKKSLSLLPTIRSYLYNLFITGISGDHIIKNILVKICSNNISEIKKHQIINIASQFDINLSRGRREMIHLDAFIVNVILILSTR